MPLKRLKEIGEKSREKKRIVYVCFIDLDEAYDRENREALWQLLLLLKSNSKVLLLGGQEKRKGNKTRKSRNEEKVVGFRSAFIFHARKREAVIQGGTMEPGG